MSDPSRRARPVDRCSPIFARRAIFPARGSFGWKSVFRAEMDPATPASGLPSRGDPPQTHPERDLPLPRSAGVLRSSEGRHIVEAAEREPPFPGSMGRFAAERRSGHGGVAHRTWTASAMAHGRTPSGACRPRSPDPAQCDLWQRGHRARRERHSDLEWPEKRRRRD